MSHSPLLIAALGFLGLLAATAIVFGTPRFLTYRLENPGPFPPPGTLIPLLGTRRLSRNRLWAFTFELLTAGLLALFAWYYGPSIRLVLAGLYVVLLLWIAYIDLEYRLVPNRLSYPGVALGLAGSLFWPRLGLVNAVEGAVVGLLIMGMLDLIGRGKLGTGDTKLAVAIGAMRGLTGSWEAVFIGILLGGLGAAFALVVLRRTRKSYIPYAPYLVAGAIISLFVATP